MRACWSAPCSTALRNEAHRLKRQAVRRRARIDRHVRLDRMGERIDPSRRRHPRRDGNRKLRVDDRHIRQQIVMRHDIFRRV